MGAEILCCLVVEAKVSCANCGLRWSGCEFTAVNCISVAQRERRGELRVKNPAATKILVTIKIYWPYRSRGGARMTLRMSSEIQIRNCVYDYRYRSCIRDFRNPDGKNVMVLSILAVKLR